MMRTLILAFAALAGAACARSFDPLEYVDPFIGTGFHGHTYPGAATPFGMVQLSPDTRADDWDACAGYHYDDTTIDGFSHTPFRTTANGPPAVIMRSNCPKRGLRSNSRRRPVRACTAMRSAAPGRGGWSSI